MSSAIRSRKLWWLGSVLFVGLGFASGCAGKSESSDGDGSGGDDAGTSGATSGTAGTTSSGGGGTTTGGTGSISKGGCGPSAGTSGKGGGCGVSGTAGSGTGGTAGSATGGGSGDAGATSGGTSGSSGAAGEAGTAGTAGTAGMSGAECAMAEDCQMVSDCCGCRADPKNAPTACALDCVRNACADDGIATTEVDCIMGRCVIARSCDRSRVTCRAAPPECPEGTLPSVVETCWGPCIAATECSRVTDCTDCGDAVCVEFEVQRPSFSCVTPASGCNQGSYCDCLGVCGFCTEGAGGVTCACPTC